MSHRCQVHGGEFVVAGIQVAQLRDLVEGADIRQDVPGQVLRAARTRGQSRAGSGGGAARQRHPVACLGASLGVAGANSRQQRPQGARGLTMKRRYLHRESKAMSVNCLRLCRGKKENGIMRPRLLCHAAASLRTLVLLLSSRSRSPLVLLRLTAKAPNPSRNARAFF